MGSFLITIGIVASVVTITIGVLTVVRMHLSARDVRKIWGITSGTVILILLGALFISEVNLNPVKSSIDNSQQTPTEASVSAIATPTLVPTATPSSTPTPILKPPPGTVVYILSTGTK